MFPSRLLLNLPKVLGRKRKTLGGVSVCVQCLVDLPPPSRPTHWFALEHFWTQWAPLVWLLIPVHVVALTLYGEHFREKPTPRPRCCFCTPPHPTVSRFASVTLNWKAIYRRANVHSPGPCPASGHFIYLGDMLLDDRMSILAWF